MATIITDTMAQQYGVKHTRILQRELQKLESELEPFVTIRKGCKGRSVEIPYIGAHKMDRRTQRGETIVRKEDKFGNIHLYPTMWGNATSFFNDDKLFNNNIDFTISDIIREDMSAIKRTKDLVILGVNEDTDENSVTYGETFKALAATAPTSPYVSCGGILGTNYSGLTGTTCHDLGDADTGNLKTSCVVPSNFVTTGSPTESDITLEKVAHAILMLKKRRAIVKGATQVIIGLTSAQIATLQMLEVAQNKNYGWGNLVDGFTNRVLGVTIMETECLPLLRMQDDTFRRICPMWIKQHVEFGTWMDPSVRVDAHLQDSYDEGQVVTQCAMGCTRTRLNTVIQILCNESGLPTAA